MREARAGRAVIYARISNDREGERNGVDRQVEDCEKLAADLGVEVVTTYVDNDVSASTRSRKPRPEFSAMLDALRAGVADTVLAYSASRLTRRPREFETLIELHQELGVVFKTVVSGNADLSTADGRGVARTLAAWDAAEAERTAERVQRASQQRAQRGEWHGGWAPFGYNFVRDGRTVVGMEVDEARGALLREMAGRVIEGESLYSLCRDLNARGATTAPGAKSTEGAMWRSRTLKRALVSPAVIGMREYDGELHQGKWPAILDRETWDRVRDVLLDPSRTDPERSWMTDTSRKRALSGLMVCGATRTEGTRAGDVCGATLVSQPIKGVPSMICHSQATGGCGHLRVNYEPVESWVVRGLVELLDSDAVRAALRDRDEDTSGEEARLRQAVKDDQRRLRTLEDQLVDELLSQVAFRRQRDRLQRRIKAASEALSALAGRRSAADVDSGADLADRLAGASVEKQRALLSGFIERVVIAPHPRGVPTNVTRRKTEAAEAYEERLRELRESTLAQRVSVEWKV